MYLTTILLCVIILYLVCKLEITNENIRDLSVECKTLNSNYMNENKKRKELAYRLSKIAYVNPQTNSKNIDFFLEYTLRQMVKDPKGSYFVMTLSIHNIGEINQLFGAKEVDKILKFIANHIKEEGVDRIYGHVQSNLFAFLFHNQKKEEVINYLRAFTEYVNTYQSNIFIDLYFGIYEVEDKSMPVMDMINASSLAQKFITDSSKYNYMFYEQSFEQQFQQNKKTIEEMEQALVDHNFLIHLQPIVDLKKYKIIAAEALVRWEHPEKGLLSPYAFLPVFESTSFVIQLDYYVWKACCKLIRRWVDNDMEPVPISVNVSPLHLQDNRFIEVLNGYIEQYKISKQYLILEIPERGFTNLSNNHERTLELLQKYEYRICMDNFGSQNTPIRLLQSTPVEMVKVDRSFTQGRTQEEQTVLKYLIALSKELGLTIIAEGIEKIEQADALSNLGADAAQGFFFSKPVDPRTFDALNKSMVKKVFPANEFYPTFEAFEEDISLLDRIANEF